MITRRAPLCLLELVSGATKIHDHGRFGCDAIGVCGWSHILQYFCWTVGAYGISTTAIDNNGGFDIYSGSIIITVTVSDRYHWCRCEVYPTRGLSTMASLLVPISAADVMSVTVLLLIGHWVMVHLYRHFFWDGGNSYGICCDCQYYSESG